MRTELHYYKSAARKAAFYFSRKNRINVLNIQKSEKGADDKMCFDYEDDRIQRENWSGEVSAIEVMDNSGQTIGLFAYWADDTKAKVTHADEEERTKALKENCARLGADASGYYLAQGNAGSWRLMKRNDSNLNYDRLVYEDPGCVDLNEDEETAAAFFAEYLAESNL